MTTVLVVVAALAGCGCALTTPDPDVSRARAVERYVEAVEPIRRAVDRLLERADPILRRYDLHRLGARPAQERIWELERSFALYAARIGGLTPVPAELALGHSRYAHTYLFEDAYLRALAEALPSRRFGGLPKTARRQRTAIVAWRVRLEAVAERLGVALPADLQQAGRGEIAPSPRGD